MWSNTCTCMVHAYCTVHASQQYMQVNYLITLIDVSSLDSIGVSAKVLIERSIQQYKLPIDHTLFE